MVGIELIHWGCIIDLFMRIIRVKGLYLTSVFFAVTVAYSVMADEKKIDAMDRNEYIGDAELSVVVTKEEDSYLYAYSIISPISNIGTIGYLVIDAQCENEMSEYDEYQNQLSSNFWGYQGDESNGYHSPVFFEDGNSQFTYTVLRGNAVHIERSMPPNGEKATFFIKSPFSPVSREYTLVPEVYPSDKYDYSNYAEDDETLPGTYDFAVSGQIKAPGCSPEPVEPPAEVVYEGNTFKNRKTNHFLTYTQPVSNYLKSSLNSAFMTIHYAEEVIPSSFQAVLNGEDVTKYFNPAQGKTETVELVGPWRNRVRHNDLELSIEGTIRPIENRDTREAGQNRFDKPQLIREDRDYFLIWRELDNAK